MKTLYDLRNDPESAMVGITNQQLAQWRPDYLERYGAIASERWWRLYDLDRISRTHNVGQVVFVGCDPSPSDDPHEIVRIRTDRRDIEYDREGFWCDPAVRVGSWVHIDKIKAWIQTQTRLVTNIIDVRIRVEDAV
jgi:hypothetical protein